jgi:HSP20 family molecular chaperone IbpA
LRLRRRLGRDRLGRSDHGVHLTSQVPHARGPPNPVHRAIGNDRSAARWLRGALSRVADIERTDTGLLVHAPVPGYGPEELSVTVRAEPKKIPVVVEAPRLENAATAG